MHTFAPTLNSYALVTGSSSGMGLEYVRQLADKGYNIIIVALFQQETDRVKDELLAKHPELDILSIGIDLSTLDSADNLYEKIKLLRPKAEIDVLINNAGVLYPIHFSNMTQEQISRIIVIHNHTMAMMCHFFIPDMLERKRGYVLNISSMAAWFPFPFISLYSATKSFTKQFSGALRTELWKSGVSVSTVYFGAVSTNLYNLSSRLRKIAISLAIMLPPEKAARKALSMMFRGRSGRIPGVLNCFFIPLMMILPRPLVSFIERQITNKWKLK